MKKIILSSVVVVLFGIYTFLVRAGDISALPFKSNPIPVKSTNNISSANPATSTGKTSATTSNTPRVAKTTKEVCAYIPSSRSDEDNYNSDDGGGTGYYKCSTIIVTSPTPTTNTAPINTTPQSSQTTPVVVTPPPAIKPKIIGIYKDGVFIGDSADAFYGMVQVSATISNGRLSDITFLSYPQDRSTSLQKSNHAMPILKSEAISTQSAKVNTVSGATYTSEAFISSLSSALTQAKI